MKINARIFSLPPYISTSWNNVLALHMKGGSLVVSLVDGDIIEIPGLNEELIELIFTSHASFLENDMACDHSNHSFSATRSQPSSSTEGSLELPIRFGLTAMDSLGAAMQHNPAQANAPDIPREILQKIGAIARIVAPDEPNALPQAEPHCNCMHCQIARAINLSQDEQEEQKAPREDPIVTDEELKFQQWTITQTGDKLFIVSNSLDNKEKYSVFLGDPVGCTCGQPGCEHILAVLKS